MALSPSGGLTAGSSSSPSPRRRPSRPPLRRSLRWRSEMTGWRLSIDLNVITETVDENTERKRGPWQPRSSVGRGCAGSPCWKQSRDSTLRPLFLNHHHHGTLQPLEAASPSFPRPAAAGKQPQPFFRCRRSTAASLPSTSATLPAHHPVPSNTPPSAAAATGEASP